MKEQLSLANETYRKVIWGASFKESLKDFPQGKKRSDGWEEDFALKSIIRQLVNLNMFRILDNSTGFVVDIEIYLHPQLTTRHGECG